MISLLHIRGNPIKTLNQAILSYLPFLMSKKWEVAHIPGRGLFALINRDVSSARPCGFRIPKLSQVRALTRSYVLVPLLSCLNPQANGVFVFVVPTSQYCHM